MLVLEIPKDLYNNTVVLKAAYLFTDRAYIYIQQTDDDYIVNFKLKNGVDAITEDEFKNDLLSQAVREPLI